jgi:hypothetical protein
MTCHAVHCRTPALLHRRLVVLVIGLVHYDPFQNDLFRGRLLAQIADRNRSGQAALVKPIGLYDGAGLVLDQSRLFGDRGGRAVIANNRRRRGPT